MFLSQGRCHGRILSRENGSASFPSAPPPATWSCTGLTACMGGAALHARRGTPTPATTSLVCVSPTSKVGQRLRVRREPGPA